MNGWVRHVGQRKVALGCEMNLPIGQLIQTIPRHLCLGQIACLQPPIQVRVTPTNLCFADAVRQCQLEGPQILDLLVGDNLLTPSLCRRQVLY